MTETFGHEPVTGLSLFDLAGRVCARCAERDTTDGRGFRVRTPWPCGTALLLGIAEQTPEVAS